VGVVCFISYAVANSSSRYSSNAGEKLTRKLRLLCFKSSLRQSMAFYDDPKNSVSNSNSIWARVPLTPKP